MKVSAAFKIRTASQWNVQNFAGAEVQSNLGCISDSLLKLNRLSEVLIQGGLRIL